MIGKEDFKKKRDGIQKGIYFVINPLVKFLIKIGITPNMVTTIGLLGNIAAAALIAYAGYLADGNQANLRFDLITWGGAVCILFSLFDMLDGQVARIGGMVSRFGALYDSVLDRYCELFMLGSISFFLIQANYPIGALVTFLALIGSIMVSYVRARAEGVGIECKIGFMQRPERVVVTAAGCLACGIVGVTAGKNATLAINILIIAMAIIAIFANLTAFARIGLCRKSLK